MVEQPTGRGRRPDPYEDQDGARLDVAWLRSRYATWKKAEEATGISRATLSAIHKGRAVSRLTGEAITESVARLRQEQAARADRARDLREHWSRPMVPREHVEKLAAMGLTVRVVVEEYLNERS